MGLQEMMAATLVASRGGLVPWGVRCERVATLVAVVAVSN